MQALPLAQIKAEEEEKEFPIKDSSGNKLVFFEVKGAKTDLFKIDKSRKHKHRTAIDQTWDYMGHGFPYGIATNYQEFILIDRSKGYKKYHYFNILDIKYIYITLYFLM